MFFNHNMTDAELIRAADCCESSHLRLMADRLKTRIDQLSEIGKLADVNAYSPPTADGMLDRLCEISEICDRE